MSLSEALEDLAKANRRVVDLEAAYEALSEALEDLAKANRRVVDLEAAYEALSSRHPATRK